MIARALDAGSPAGWVAGDEVYGADPGLRARPEDRQVGYVLAVAKSHRSPPRPAPAGPTRSPRGCRSAAWQRLSAGPGRQGPPLL